MPEIQGGRWDNYLRRLFEIKDQGIAPAVMPELAGQVVVQPDAPELAYLRGEQLRGAQELQGAVAGEYSYVQLLVPDGGTNVVTVEGIRVINGAAGSAANFHLTLATATSGTRRSTIHCRDARVHPYTGNVAQLAGNCEVRDGSAVAIDGSIVESIRVPADYTGDFLVPWVLFPHDNTRLTVWNAAQNASLRVTFVWRERPYNPSELDKLE